MEDGIWHDPTRLNPAIPADKGATPDDIGHFKV